MMAELATGDSPANETTRMSSVTVQVDKRTLKRPVEVLLISCDKHEDWKVKIRESEEKCTRRWWITMQVIGWIMVIVCAILAIAGATHPIVIGIIAALTTGICYLIYLPLTVRADSSLKIVRSCTSSDEVTKFIESNITKWPVIELRTAASKAKLESTTIYFWNKTFDYDFCKDVSEPFGNFPETDKPATLLKVVTDFRRADERTTLFYADLVEDLKDAAREKNRVFSYAEKVKLDGKSHW